MCNRRLVIFRLILCGDIRLVFIFGKVVVVAYVRNRVYLDVLDGNNVALGFGILLD